MKFTGALYLKAQLIQRVASIVQAPAPPDLSGQYELLSLLGSIAIRGKHTIHYDGTIEAAIAGTKTDRAIGTMSLHGIISPDLRSGLLPETCTSGWKKAVLSGRFQRVMNSPPPIPKNFPQTPDSATTKWLGKWTKLLEEASSQSTFSVSGARALKDTDLRGNKLLAGMMFYSAEVGPEDGAFQSILNTWRTSDELQRYQIASGLINSAFRPFLLTSMANATGGVSLMDDDSVSAITELEYSILSHALKVIPTERRYRVTVEDLVDDEPDLLLLAGLRVIRNADARRGPFGLVEEALNAASYDQCLNSLFHSIVLEAGALNYSDRQSLSDGLTDILESLKAHNLTKALSLKRKWVNALHSDAAEIIAKTGTGGGGLAIAHFGAMEPSQWLSVAGLAGGLIAGKVLTKMLSEALCANSTIASKYSEPANLDAAAKLVSNLSDDIVDIREVGKRISWHWERRRRFFTAPNSLPPARVFIFRHGRVKKKNDFNTLSAAGEKFRDWLADYFSKQCIQLKSALYDWEHSRCLNTLASLNCEKIGIGPRSPSGFRTLNAALAEVVEGDHAVCVRAETFESGQLYHIKDFELHVPFGGPDHGVLSKAATDSAYDCVYICELYNGVWHQVSVTHAFLSQLELDQEHQD